MFDKGETYACIKMYFEKGEEYQEKVLYIGEKSNDTPLEYSSGKTLDELLEDISRAMKIHSETYAKNAQVDGETEYALGKSPER